MANGSKVYLPAVSEVSLSHISFKAALVIQVSRVTSDSSSVVVAQT